MSIYRLRTQMGQYFKWLLLLVVVPVFVIGGVFYFGGVPSGPGRGGPGESDVIAIVNSAEIKRGDFETLWEQTVEQARRSGMRSALQLADMRMAIFQQLVSDHMLADAARQLGVDVSESAVDQQLEKYVTMYLKQNRRVVLGKLSAKREAIDPREDREYIEELERSGMSLKQQEQMAESQLPREQVRAQLAQMGIARVLASRTKPVTEADIMASYKVYHIRQLILRPGLPEAQLAARGAKIRAAAEAGTDFAKLVRDNTSDETAARTGGKADYSFETRFMFPPDVRDAIEKMKPGEVSRPINTQAGVYIVKLEGVETKLPAKLDAKAKEARRQEIAQERQMIEQMKFQQQAQARQRVKVLDPEFLAYWQLLKVQNAPVNAQQYAKQVALAIKALRAASGSRANNYVQIQLAKLLDRTGQTAEAARILYPMLEGKDASIEGADLRIMLADMLLKTAQPGDKERAIQQLLTASEVAPHDVTIHRLLVAKFNAIKRPDLAAKEEKWIADYEKQKAEVEAYRKKQSSAPLGPPRR